MCVPIYGNYISKVKKTAATAAVAEQNKVKYNIHEI